MALEKKVSEEVNGNIKEDVSENVSENVSKDIDGNIKRRFNLPRGVYYGKCLRWISEKGYGFITSKRFPGEHIFVHHEDILSSDGEFRALKSNKFYSFKLEISQRGYRGREVALLQMPFIK